MSVLRVATGNFLEMYDFFVFGYYAPAIGRTFFPSQSEFASLMSSLMTFGVGFLMRPLGALVMGAYIDVHGRRIGLLWTLGLMAFGTFLIAAVPGYHTLGLLAPALVVFGRLLQGFSAGVEVGGASVYLAEIAPPGRRGLYVAWQPASQQVAVITVALIGVVLGTVLPANRMGAWGWRIPFFIGCLIVPLLFALRRSLPETAAFLNRTRRLTPRQTIASVVSHWPIVLTGMLMVTMPSVWFYMITAYTPTFGKEVLKLGGVDALIVTLCIGISNLFWLPVMGALSDRVGRRPLLLAFTAIALLTAYPAMSWLVDSPSFARLLAVELWLSFLYGGYNGAMIARLAEVMPADVRVASFAVAYSLATAVFGGFTPAISQYLIHITDNKAMPAVWLSFAAACGLIATFLADRRAVRATWSEGESVSAVTILKDA